MLFDTHSQYYSRLCQTETQFWNQLSTKRTEDSNSDNGSEAATVLCRASLTNDNISKKVNAAHERSNDSTLGVGLVCLQKRSIFSYNMELETYVKTKFENL